MKFLTDVHRAIFDPFFYREILAQSRVRVVLFVFKLLVFTSLIMGFSKAFYFVHSERGVAALVSALFGDMEIRDGRLLTERDMPYAVPGDLLTALMNRVVGYPNFVRRLPDNFLVVDTRTPPADYGEKSSTTGIVMKDASVRFVYMRADIAYEALIGKRDFQFTVPAIQEYLYGCKTATIAHFAFTSLFFGFLSVTMSAFFLSLAAYIFSADRSAGYSGFLRMACYSVTPVMLGSAAVSLSGVSAEWTWHVFIVISTVIMFRAMSNRSSDRASEGKSEAPQ